MPRGKYRLRTWLRGHAPTFANGLVPKGRDCGAHEWYRQTSETDACYHCVTTRPHAEVPIDAAAIVELEAAARAGSVPALRVLDRMIVEGTAHVVPEELGR